MESMSGTREQGREGRRGRKYRPRELRQRLYESVLELRREGHSYKEIQRRICDKYGVSLSKSTISEWTRRVHTPYGDGLGEPSEDQRLHKLKICPELAYVMGAILGDGSVHNEGHGHNALVLAVKDYDFTEEFARCLAVALCRDEPYRPCWDRSRKRWVVRAYDKRIYQLLRGKDLEKLNPYVEHCEDCIKAFIRGFADAEGTVDKHNSRIQIANTDKASIDYIARLLGILGIHSKIYKRRRKRTFVIDGRVRTRRHTTIYILSIHRRNGVRRFGQLVGFAIRRKQQGLEAIAQIQLPSPSPNPNGGAA